MSLYRLLGFIFPIVLLVAYSQLIVKWRVNVLDEAAAVAVSAPQRLLASLTDPYVLSAYAAALFASFAWLFVVARLPLAVAFPVYQGLTFAVVIMGSHVLLQEPLSPQKLAGVSLILIGIAIGASE